MGGSRGSGRLGRSVVITLGIVAVLAAGVAPAAAAKRPSQDTSSQADPIAKLVVEHTNVEVRRDGKRAFRPAEDGASLHEGDTVRTDATGRATVQYTDKSFTRLDVNTEFTIVELTDDDGTRHTDGSLSTGRIWNRVEDLTESQAFESEGAGATAAVEGTAYAVACINPAACVFDGVVHDVTLTGNVESNSPKTIEELQRVLVTLGVVGDVQVMSLQDFYGDEWIQQNLAIDAFLGYAGPDWQKDVVIVTNPDGSIEVAGVVVSRPPTQSTPNTPNGGGGTPPPSGGGNNQQGFGAGGGTNSGGASFNGGNQGHPTGNCMSQGAGQGHGQGQPDPQPCLGG